MLVCVRVARLRASDPLAYPVGQSGETTVVLGDNNSCGESGEGAERDVKRAGRGGFFIVISEG